MGREKVRFKQWERNERSGSSKIRLGVINVGTNRDWEERQGYLFEKIWHYFFQGYKVGVERRVGQMVCRFLARIHALGSSLSHSLQA